MKTKIKTNIKKIKTVGDPSGLCLPNNAAV